MKKYFYRLSYILFLMYVPGIILAVYIHAPCTNPDHTTLYVVAKYLNPWIWIEDWVNLLNYIWLGNWLMIMAFIPVFYLLWRWFKKPGWITALLLLFSFVILNPLNAPQDRLLGYFLNQRPLIQSFR